MNIVRIKTPMGWQAYENDQFDGDPRDIGHGDTEQECVDDLCEALGLNYSVAVDDGRQG